MQVKIILTIFFYVGKLKADNTVVHPSDPKYPVFVIISLYFSVIFAYVNLTL